MEGRRDVFDLLMPIFSGSKDDFGKDIVPPLPLFYDRVNESRPPLASSAASILFRLPIELRSAIIQLLPSSSLASLALVSRDCRQLARSAQFASVVLDYGPSSIELILALIKEGSERTGNNGSTASPSLGACIRRLKVETNPGWLSYRHQIALSEEFNALEESIRKTRLADAEHKFFDEYLPAVLMVIAFSLPHLELLDWEDKVIVPRTFFTRLARSPVQHLKLFRLKFDDNVEIDELAERRGWRLRTLDIEPSVSIFGRSNDSGISTARICNSILRACAPTLENLVWTGYLLPDQDPDQEMESQSLVTGSNLGHLSFPYLTQLRLPMGRYPDHRILRAIFGMKSECNLRVLEADPEKDEMLSLIFENAGRMPSLETFVWPGFPKSAEHALRFLECNTQLSKLAVPHEADPILLEQRLLPLLSGSFDRLKSLRLAWAKTSIPNSALEIIGSLQSLEQICLSAGTQIGWRHDWQIDHNVMRNHLSKLTELRKVAFPRDSYSQDETFTESYYDLRMPLRITQEIIEEIEASEGRRLERAALEQLWENEHRDMILDEADKYIEVLPNLEWMYFGQLPVGVTESNDESDGPSEEVGGTQRRMAYALSEERDDCYTLLNMIFGAESSRFEASP